MDERPELRDILRKNSLMRGHFLLSSGKTSDYYLDCKRTTLGSPRGLELSSKLILDRILRMTPRPDAVGGLTIGAEPLSVTVSQLALRVLGWSLPVFVVRDEKKAHGTEQVVEGGVRPGWSVVILDDVMTTGKSVLKAIEAVKEQGAQVQGVIILIDREEGGQETLKEYQVESLFSYRDLLGA